jgi:hypothetical protein
MQQSQRLKLAEYNILLTNSHSAAVNTSSTTPTWMFLTVSGFGCCREKRVTNSIAFALLGLQLQASGPLTVLNSTR